MKHLVECQGYQCALSGIDLTPESAELDHIVPLTNGGDHVMQNIQIVDVRINRMKGTMSNDEFIDLCVKVAEFAGKKNEKDK